MIYGHRRKHVKMMSMQGSPEMYTPENIVFSSGVSKADTTKPVNVYTDSAGNHALSDGNHRAARALIEGVLDELPRNVIGHVDKNVSIDPDYRPIKELKIIENRE